MKRKLLVRTLIAAMFTLPAAAMAVEPDCFPMCAEPAKMEITVENQLDAITIVWPRDIAAGDAVSTSCESGLVKQAEYLNAKIKPIRELVGYVRSPQGLAIKLVNDHIVKIPAWVGYAMDPIGSIKHRALDEVKTQVKDAMADGKDCALAPADTTVYPAVNIYLGHSI